MDTTGTVVQTWGSVWAPGTAVYLEDNGTLTRAVRKNSTLAIGGVGGGIERVAWDGTLLWDYTYNGPGFVQHHDLEVLPNGNVLLIAWEEKTVAEAVAAGRDPALMDSLIMTDGIFRPDMIVEIEQTGPTTGQVVWEWHVWDHMIQDFDNTKANFGVVEDHPELVDLNFPPTTPNLGDWNHGNSLDYDPIHDRIIYNPRDQGEVWIIDHSTTIAEAAGHTGGTWGRGGDILYRWGNPQAYRAGTIFDQKLFGHHAPVMIEEGCPGAGNLVIFNNQAFGTASAIWEIELPLDSAGNYVINQTTGRYDPVDPIWTYGDSMPGDPQFFFSQFVSNAERLPNGNTLICSGMEGRLFEVDPAGTVVWEHLTGGPLVFHVHYIPETLWGDVPSISLAAGGTVNFQIVAGSPMVGNAHFLFGTVSGTSPGVVLDGVPVPINIDGYSIAVISQPNTYPLFNSVAFVDLDSQSTAQFSLPDILPPELAGFFFHHAYVMLDPTTGLVVQASNAVSTLLVP